MSVPSRLFSSLLLCVLAASPAWARKPKPAQVSSAPPAAVPAPAPAEPVRVTAVEGITEYRLDNGLRVLLFPDQTKQTITVNVTYLVGSRHENYGETGMAHLLEHMVFKGSTHHTEIPKELSSHGARPNGSTSWDRTNYFETFNATEENLRWALDLESDRMVNSFIAKKDLDSEMTVVRNEYEGGENSPPSVMFKRLLAAAYDWHNYAKIPIGARSDIENVAIENLQAFYHQYYQPDNALLLVAGKIDEAAVLKLVQQYFGPLPRPTRTLPVLHTIEPAQDGERQVTLRRVGDVQIAAVMYHVPAGSHDDFAALQVLGQVLADAPAGRLYKELVASGKAAQVFSFALQLADPGMAGFGVIVREGQPLDPVLASLIGNVEKTTEKPLLDAEVERARAGLLSQIELSLNNSEGVGLALSDWAAMGDWRLMFLDRDRLRTVKTADVQRVWNTYFHATNRTAGLFHPTKQPDRVEIPAKPDTVALLKDYKGDAARDAGEAFDPSPANIDAHTLLKKSAGGMQLALLPKKTRGGAVFASLTLRYGALESLANLGDVPSMATYMLMRGTTKHTRQQLADEFDRLKARINFNTWGSGTNVFVETTRENLPAVLKLLTEVLREPAFDAKEFEQLRTERLSGTEQQRSDPQSLAFTAFGRQLNPYPRGDIRYTESIEETVTNIKSVKREDVQRFHREFFGASPSEMAVVGDFDAQALEAQIVSLLGGWKAQKPFAIVHNEYHAVPGKEIVIETPDKAQAIFIAGQNIELRDDDPDYPALVLGNYMLGGGFMNSRLMARIRGKDGLSYGVGSQLSADAIDKDGGFFAYAIYAPENLAKLQQAFNEEMTRVLKEDFTAEELALAKSGWLQSRSVARAQDNSLAATLGHYRFIGRTFAWDADLEKKVQALDGAQIRAALVRHIDPANFTIIKAGDYAGTAAKKKP